MMCSNLKKLWACTSLCFLLILPSRAQVRPLPVIPPDSLVQTYTGRLAHTLLNGYVTHDSLTATLRDYVLTSDARLSDSRTPKGTAGGDLVGNYPNPAIKSSVTLTGNPTVEGTLAASDSSNKIATTAFVKQLAGAADGDLTGTYPNPTIKSSVNLTGNPTAPTPATSTNSTQIATTAYVKSNLSSYVQTSDSRLTDSRTPTGAAGGDLTGTYPNPTIKPSVTLTGNPTVSGTLATSDNSTKVATTAFVKNNLSGYVATSDARLTDSRTPKGSAGGDLTGSYPNPTIKSSVNLTGNPTVSGNLTTGGTLTVNGTGESRIQGNLTTGGTLTVNGTGESRIQGNLRIKGSGNYGNKINLGDGDYVYLHEATDDNLTIKARNIDLTPTSAVTAPTPATSDNSTKVATTAFVKAVTTSKLAANFEYMTNSSSQKVYVVPFNRGGRKMNDEKAFICRVVSKDLEWCSAALVGNTYTSVQITDVTSYAGNYIYQMADGRYINIINKEGQVGPYGFVLFKTDTEEILVRSTILLPCSISEFISNISQFSF